MPTVIVFVGRRTQQGRTFLTELSFSNLSIRCKAAALRRPH
jgi:hypothetical protein